MADSPPKPRTRVERTQQQQAAAAAKPAPAAPTSSDDTRRPVSVWTLVNANRQKK